MSATILVVDDTPTNLQLLVKFLADAGYRILVAEDGETALEQTAHNKPDVILLDITMPGIDGYETCQRLKRSPETQEIPVIFMTARSQISDKLKGFEVGGVDYIIKPFEKEEVTARVHTQLTIVRQKRELQQMLEQRHRFMCMAAHDLRNPLTVLSCWSELGIIASDPIEMKGIFQKMKDAAGHMASIIEDFLELSILHAQQAGKMAIFDLQTVVEQVADQQTFSAKAKGISLVMQIPPGPLLALGNRSQTHQILTNYLSNALKYSPIGTRTAITMAATGKSWRVQIQDQGPGIPPHERGGLFCEFARISSKPTGGERSTGLGLSIVKALAEAQGGRVGAEFPSDGGSVFWVEIPVP